MSVTGWWLIQLTAHKIIKARVARNAVFFLGPGAKINQLTAFRAKRTVFVLRFPFNLFAALRALYVAWHGDISRKTALPYAGSAS